MIRYSIVTIKQIPLYQLISLLLFPQRLKNKNKNTICTEILDVFKHVYINISTLKAIKQVLSFAKFLKDMCTMKRCHNVQKKKFIAEQVHYYAPNAS